MNPSMAEEETVHHTFLYFHCSPFRRHILQLASNGQVQLMSASEDFAVMASGWHGTHTYNGARGSWFFQMHYTGVHAREQRVLVAHEDLVVNTYNVYHHGAARWAYIVALPRMSSVQAFQLLNPRLQAPPATFNVAPPPMYSAVQPEPQVVIEETC